jgi:hypothetical protein
MKPSKIRLSTSKMLKFGLSIMYAVLLSGCGISYLASRETNPVIQDYAQTSLFSKHSTVVFATTASRRLALVAEVNNRIITCAEPSPDVGESFASSIAAGLQAAGTVTPATGTKVSAELAAQYARAVATQIAPLLYRTQGLQLYRDSIYKLCIDRMNDWITQDEYAAERKAKYIQAIDLIKEELPLMQKTVEVFFTNVKAGESKVNVDDVVKLLEAQKKEAKAPAPNIGQKLQE